MSQPISDLDSQCDGLVDGNELAVNVDVDIGDVLADLDDGHRQRIHADVVPDSRLHLVNTVPESSNMFLGQHAQRRADVSANEPEEKNCRKKTTSDRNITYEIETVFNRSPRCLCKLIHEKSDKKSTAKFYE